MGCRGVLVVLGLVGACRGKAGSEPVTAPAADAGCRLETLEAVPAAYQRATGEALDRDWLADSTVIEDRPLRGVVVLRNRSTCEDCNSGRALEGVFVGCQYFSDAQDGRALAALGWATASAPQRQAIAWAWTEAVLGRPGAMQSAPERFRREQGHSFTPPSAHIDEDGGVTLDYWSGRHGVAGYPVSTYAAYAHMNVRYGADGKVEIHAGDHFTVWDDPGQAGDLQAGMDGARDAGPRPPRTVATVEVEVRKAIIDDDGGLDHAATAEIGSKLRDDVETCYRKALAGDGSLKGRIDVTLSVDGNGRTTQVDVSGFDARVDDCVKTAVENRRFAARPKRLATLEFPIMCRAE